MNKALYSSPSSVCVSLEFQRDLLGVGSAEGMNPSEGSWGFGDDDDEP